MGPPILRRPLLFIDAVLGDEGNDPAFPAERNASAVRELAVVPTNRERSAKMIAVVVERCGSNAPSAPDTESQLVLQRLKPLHQSPPACCGREERIICGLDESIEI